MRTRRSVTGLGIVIAACGVCAAIALVRVIRAEAKASGPVVEPPRADTRPALVVFGCETLPTGPSRELSSRLSHAHRLWQAGSAEVVVLSGGVSGTLDEVADMAAFLVEAGVPAEVMVECRPGGNTRETVASMARVGQERSLGPWIAVSTPFHARRIRDEARRVGIAVVVSGPSDSPETLNRAVHRSRVVTEAVATVYYLLPTSLTKRVRTTTGTLRHRLPLLLAGRPGDFSPAPDEAGSS